MTGLSFLGFARPDGAVGVRNHVLVLSILGLASQVARRIHAQVAGTRVVTTPYGRGQVGADADLHRRTLAGLGRNPNVAAVLVVGADRKAVALRDLAAGGPVRKYGEVIGEATGPIPRGGFVHVHNLRSCRARAGAA